MLAVKDGIVQSGEVTLKTVPITPSMALVWCRLQPCAVARVPASSYRMPARIEMVNGEPVWSTLRFENEVLFGPTDGFKTEQPNRPLRKADRFTKFCE